MRLPLALTALLTAVPTLATVIPSPRIGTVIPLNKRANILVDEQGVVKPEVLKKQVNQVISKLNRGFQAYQRNTGQRHPGYTETLQARATGADPLVDNNQLGELWYGAISVGTPPRQFTVIFDTGASDTFLPAVNCGLTCQGHQLYDPAKSFTGSDQHRTFSIAFLSGAIAQGEIFRETVTVSGLTAVGQAFGAATQYSAQFQSDQFPADGLLGMAFPQISAFREEPFFHSLIFQGRVTAAEFGFKLTVAGPSELFLGGVNPNLFTGNFTNVGVTQQGFWQVNLDAVNTNGKATVSGKQAILDTGTAFIIAPEDQVAQFYAAIPGSRPASTLGDGFFTFPCNTNPNVSLTFGGKQFAIPLNSFNLGQPSTGSPDCIGGIIGVSIGLSSWVIGNNFLTNVYTKFDVGNSQVGFARLA